MKPKTKDKMEIIDISDIYIATAMTITKCFLRLLPAITISMFITGSIILICNNSSFLKASLTSKLIDQSINENIQTNTFGNKKIVNEAEKISENTYIIIFLLVFLSVIVSATVGMVLLIKYRLFFIFHGLISVMIVMIFTVIFHLQISNLLLNSKWRIFIDYVSYIFLFLNLSMAELLTMLWKGPLIIQKYCQIKMSIILSIHLLSLLDSIVIYCLLVFLAIWDVLAVLCPRGPLNLMIKNVQKQGLDLPRGLVYSTNANNDKCNLDSSYSNSHEPKSNRSTFVLKEPVEVHSQISCDKIPDRVEFAMRLKHMCASRGDGDMKLGLGDFVFYSVMTGLMCKEAGIIGGVTAYCCIITGLLCTIMFLICYQRALPALPISIMLSTICGAISISCTQPFLSTLFDQQGFL